MSIFKKEKEESLVSRLCNEVSKQRSVYDMYTHLMFGRDETQDENRKKFEDLLDPYFKDYMEKEYSVCKECGVLVVKGKESTVSIVDENGKEEKKEEYCICCKPQYDKVKIARIYEYDKDGDSECVGEQKSYYKDNVECSEEGDTNA